MQFSRTPFHSTIWHLVQPRDKAIGSSTTAYNLSSAGPCCFFLARIAVHTASFGEYLLYNRPVSWTTLLAELFIHSWNSPWRAYSSGNQTCALGSNLQRRITEERLLFSVYDTTGTLTFAANMHFVCWNACSKLLRNGANALGWQAVVS